MMQTEVKHLVADDWGEAVPLQFNTTFCSILT